MSEDWRKESGGGNKFINWKSGPVIGIFKEVRQGEGKWGPCKIVVIENKQGQEQTYNTNSKRLLGQLSEVPYGTVVKMERWGESTNTQFSVEIVEAIKNKGLINETIEQIGARNAEAQESADKVGGKVVDEGTAWDE